MLKIHLYELIHSNGLTQRQLAQAASVREGTVSDMCNNISRMLSVHNLSNICEALNCRIEDILEYVPDEH